MKESQCAGHCNGSCHSVWLSSTFSSLAGSANNIRAWYTCVHCNQGAGQCICVCVRERERREGEREIEREIFPWISWCFLSPGAGSVIANRVDEFREPAIIIVLSPSHKPSTYIIVCDTNCAVGRIVIAMCLVNSSQGSLKSHHFSGVCRGGSGGFSPQKKFGFSGLKMHGF